MCLRTIVLVVCLGCVGFDGRQSDDAKTCVLRDLIAAAKDAEERAKATGFAWTTIPVLLNKAEQAIAQGKHTAACQYLREVKTHAELAIAQATYAKTHWQLLVPVEDKAE